MKKALFCPIITTTDKKILYFMWQYKIATFEALRVLFYPSITPAQTYQKLIRLKKGGFLEVEKLKGTKNNVWGLAPIGFKFLQNCCDLPVVRNEMYKPLSQYHDLVVASALLGQWRLNPPIGVKIVSEQEIQNTEVNFLPYDYSSEMRRRPDGLWYFENGNKPFAVALEVETTVKSSDRYVDICLFQASHLFLKNIVWIVESKSHARKILACSKKYGNPRPGLHLFILMKDFLERGWDCELLGESHKGVTLANYLNSLAGVKTENATSLQRVLDESSTCASLNNEKNNIFLYFKISLGKSNSLKDQKIAKKT